MEFLSIDKIFFIILGYPMSYIEFFGTLAGGIAVWISAKANVWSWPIGLINVVLLFFLFYQVQLYPDMFLQIFFFTTNIMGWWRWTHPRPGEEDRKLELKVSTLSNSIRVWIVVLSFLFTIVLGAGASRLNEWMPTVFSKPAAFPYFDSFVTVISIVAQYLLLQKKLESWALWILADIVATYLYFAKEIKFLGLEYLAFCFIAAYGLWNWARELRSYSS